MKARSLLSAALACLAGGLAGCGRGAEPRAAPRVLSEPLEAFDLAPELRERVQEARQAVLDAPDQAAAWGELGLVCHANFLSSLALPCYEEAERLAPQDPRWPYQRALALVEAGAIEEALGALQRCLELSPSLASLHWHVGQAELELGHLPRAQEAFEQALRLAPEESAAWSGRARVRLLGGDVPGALEDLAQALRRDPGEAYAHHLLGIALRLAGRDEEADAAQALGRGSQPVWENAFDRQRGEELVVTVGARRKVAQELYDAGRIDDAIAVLERLSGELGDDLPHLRFLGRAYLRAERVEDALETFRRCAALAPEDRTTLVGLAEAQLRAGLEAEALATAERAATLHPRYGAAHHFVGVLRERAGDAPGAIAAFRECLRFDQRNAPTWLALGRLLLDARRWEEARETYTLALRADVRAPEVQLGLARARLMLGDLDGAAEALESAAGEQAQPAPLRRLRADLERARAAARPESEGAEDPEETGGSAR